MKLSEIRQILHADQIHPSKSLGQNFMHDGNQLRRVVAAARLTRQDRVLEIGPGLGSLTERLLAEAGQVLAIEKDQRLAEFLRRRWPEARHLSIIHADALDYFRAHPGDWSDWKVVANLPYSIASPLLVDLAQGEKRPRDIGVTLQLEVAQRLTAQPGTADYGVLSLLLQLFYEPRDSFRIPSGSFYPPPSVDSACVTLARRPQQLLSQEQVGLFGAIVKQGFSQRRKMMLKLLKEKWPATRLDTAFEQLELSPQVRAEGVSLPQFVQLTKLLATGEELQP